MKIISKATIAAGLGTALYEVLQWQTNVAIFWIAMFAALAAACVLAAQSEERDVPNS